MSLTEHHRRKSRSLHIQRFSWFTFMVGGLFIVQLFANMHPVGAKSQVLAYATDISRTDLYSLTNQNRAAAGLGDLNLNAKLNSAAQAKAEHMIANDYWSHVAPDGTTPWHFFDVAGYDYSNAGENLAYGFLTSSGVMNGWMNSPGHKANVLGNYVDVGFGIANGANYQGGENTVVVAMYGTPAQAPVAAPAPAAPVQPAMNPPAAPVAPAPASPPVAPAPTAAPPAAPSPLPQTAVKTAASKPAATLQTPQQSSAVSAIQASASWPLYASSAIIVISIIGFSSTHWRLLRLNWNRGVRYAFAHPMIDAAVAGSVSLLALSATVGFIR